MLLVFFVLCPNLAYGQKDVPRWYFGHKKGLDFNYEPPRVIESAMSSGEGCANAFNRKTGELLFYTNGVNVWNREHKIMQNGEGLNGHYSSAQTALVVPFPEDSTKYYIFTTDNAGYEDTPVVGLSYSVVDLRYDNGNGRITVKNKNLLPKCTERLVGVLHCNDRDYWAIAKDATRFYAYLVSPNGIGQPIITEIGIPEDKGDLWYVGYLKASPDRSMLAMSAEELVGLQLFKFDPGSGVVENALHLNLSLGTYTSSFSPDSRLLYIGAFPILFQCDVSSWDKDAMEASVIGLDTLFDAGRETNVFVGLQLGADNRLYVSRSTPWLGRINFPNKKGLGCDYQDSVINFGSASIGFPNFIDAIGPGSKCKPPIALVTVPDSICESECIELVDRSAGYVVEVYWTVVNEGNELAHSSDRTFQFCPTRPGIYRIQLIAANSGGSDTVYRTVVVKPSLDASREVVLQVTHEVVYPGDTVTYSVASGALSNLPAGVLLTGALEYDTTVMTPVPPAIGDKGRVRIELSSADTVRVRFVTHVGRIDSAGVRWKEVHWQNACAMPVRTIDGSLKLRVRREGGVLVQEGKSSTIRPFPNPSSGPTRLMIDLAREGDVELHLVDAAGRIVQRLDRGLVVGKNWIDLDLRDLAAGTYRVTLKSQSEFVSESFILLN